MTKEKLILIIQGILKTDIDLNFLMQLKENDLETLVACIRARRSDLGSQNRKLNVLKEIRISPLMIKTGLSNTRNVPYDINSQLFINMT